MVGAARRPGLLGVGNADAFPGPPRPGSPHGAPGPVPASRRSTAWLHRRYHHHRGRDQTVRHRGGASRAGRNALRGAQQQQGRVLIQRPRPREIHHSSQRHRVRHHDLTHRGQGARAPRNRFRSRSRSGAPPRSRGRGQAQSSPGIPAAQPGGWRALLLSRGHRKASSADRGRPPAHGGGYADRMRGADLSSRLRAVDAQLPAGLLHGRRAGRSGSGLVAAAA